MFTSYSIICTRLDINNFPQFFCTRINYLCQIVLSKQHRNHFTFLAPQVPRSDRLLEWAIQVMKTHADRKAILEVEFLDEEGTGLGPTLEFFALVAAELQRKDHGMWVCDDGEEEEAGDKEREAAAEAGEKPAGYYVVRATGLFPAPLPQDSDLCNR